MNLHEIIKRLREGSLDIDFQGHLWANDPNQKEAHAHSKKQLLERLYEYYEDLVVNAAGAGDGKWSMEHWKDKSIEEVNKDMRAHYQRYLDRKNDNLECFNFWKEYKCWSCGASLYLYYDDKRDVILASHTWDNKKGLFKWCELPLMEPTKDSITIDGNIVFMNFFPSLRDDCPDEDKYSEPYSLNYFLGRKNITHWKAKNQNVAYGQMGNMSVGIYVNPAKDHIIVSSPYLSDYVGGEESRYDIAEAKNILDNYQYMGDICLGVWRWEATDFSTLGITDIKDFEKKQKKDYHDVVSFDVKPGTWEFTHYYDQSRTWDYEPTIYSELKLK